MQYKSLPWQTGKAFSYLFVTNCNKKKAHLSFSALFMRAFFLIYYMEYHEKSRNVTVMLQNGGSG
jgi:hypothetical protein